MSIVRTCLAYLDARSVVYAHTRHAVAYAFEESVEVQDMPPHPVAKTIVCKGDGGHLLVVVPVSCNVDIAQVTVAASTKKLHLATENESAVLFPFSEAGAVPPLGGLVGVPVYLDRELANQEFIAFNAGTHSDLIHMKTADFRQIAETIIGSFGCRDYQEEFRQRLLALRKATGV